MVALPSGKQCCIHGPAVNVPSKLDTICTLLPRLPSQTELIPLKLKRKLQYKGHYMYNYVRPDKVINALIWMKANNPLYVNISINNDWINDSLANDTELFTSLTQQPNEVVNTEQPNEIVNTEQPNEIVNTEELNEIVNTEELNEVVNTEELNEIVNTEELNEIVNTEELHEVVTTEQPNEIVTTEQPEETMEVSTSDQLDIITNAYNMLSSIAQRNGYNIHNDGNCLFAAIAYQLPSIGIHTCNIDIHALRNNVVSHLEKNPYVDDVHYCNFLSAPVSTSNSYMYNADTEAPTEYISSIGDPNIQAQLHKYLQRLSEGAWGDNITVQGICEMLNITINILSTLNPNTVVITPNTGTSQGNVYIALIEQYHCVGLDKVEVPSNVCESESTDDSLNDVTIEEGDEHTRQITGGPQESMLSVENTEADDQIYSVAPAEGQYI